MKFKFLFRIITDIIKISVIIYFYGLIYKYFRPVEYLEFVTNPTIDNFKNLTQIPGYIIILNIAWIIGQYILKYVLKKLKKIISSINDKR